jgi:hypothetical protein
MMVSILISPLLKFPLAVGRILTNTSEICWKPIVCIFVRKHTMCKIHRIIVGFNIVGFAYIARKNTGIKIGRLVIREIEKKAVRWGIIIVKGAKIIG